MKKIFAIAAIALATASPVQAKVAKSAGHTWFSVNYATAKCTFNQFSPEAFYNGSLLLQGATGVVMDRIAPENVTKEDGDIHVHMTGAKSGSPVEMDFFTSIRACEKFVAYNGLVPEQADSGDIN